MKVVGLVTEYNPFHNGHLHHLRESLRTTGADVSVAVMSGHFLQRGEPAIVDKWVRTEMALAAGLDLVLELPFPFACNSAQHFARGAVLTLEGLGVVDALCFGSELGELRPLREAAASLQKHAEQIDAETRELLRRGISYPAARADVLAEEDDQLAAAAFRQPNNILGLEYLHALSAVKSRIEPATIPRLGPGYHEAAALDGIASATGVRARLARGEAVSTLVPSVCHRLLQEALQKGNGLEPGRLFTALSVSLLKGTIALRGIYQVEHGLENRLAEAALQACNFADLTAGVKSRQWTATRIQRILMYVLLQAQKEAMDTFVKVGPLYLRLLGMSEQGRRCLAKARSRKNLPMIADPAKAAGPVRRFYRGDAERAGLAESMLALDLRASRVYTALKKVQREENRNRDFFEPVRRRE